MDKSKRTACFLPCAECGMHGHIVCADGRESQEFGTIFKGLEVLRAMLLRGEVTRAEGARIMHQLEESGMPPQDDGGDRAMELLIKLRGQTEEGFRDLFDEIHRVMRSGEVDEEEKRVLH